jgi:RNA polymerase sigma factor (sigma-70 family)
VSNQDWKTLFLAHGRALRQFLFRRVSCPDTAADLTQETFARLIRAEPAAVLQDPRAYLFRTAANLAADHWRARARAGPQANAEAAETAEDPQPLPDRALLSREEFAVLRQAVADLPPRTREVFLLHKGQGLSYADIALRLGIAKNTVTVHMVRALGHCRKRLENYHRDQ